MEPTALSGLIPWLTDPGYDVRVRLRTMAHLQAQEQMNALWPGSSWSFGALHLQLDGRNTAIVPHSLQFKLCLRWTSSMASGYGLNGGESSYASVLSFSVQFTALARVLRSMTTILTLDIGPSRCYPFWQEVMACYVTNTSPYDNTGAKQCVLPLEDYLECLHHRKEVRSPQETRRWSAKGPLQKLRVARLQEAYHKKELSSPAEGMKTAKEIRSLGLLDVPAEQKHLNTYGGWLKPKDPKDR